jgi:MraZ protein
MPESQEFVLGEFHRKLDERHRLSIPNELIDHLDPPPSEYILAKERPGCLSLWSGPLWQEKLEEGIDLVQRRMRAGKLQGRFEEVQTLGRLLSTRHARVELAGRGRLLVPEGFREFLRVGPGEEVVVVGAAICIEIWHPQAWRKYLAKSMIGFRTLFEQLSG